MKTLNRTYWLPYAIAAAFIAVAAFAIVSYLNTLAIRESERLVARSYSIREATDQLLSAMKDAETGQRGYLLTGDETFLTPFHTGIEKAEEKLKELESLSEGARDTASRVGILRESFQKQLKHLNETIELRRIQPAARVSDEVLELVKSGRGKTAMEAAREASRQIVANQTMQLKDTESKNSYLSSMSRTTITVGNTIALALILATALAAYHDRKKRDAAEVALLAQQAELAAVVDSAFEGIITRDQDFTIRFVNPAAANILGVDVKQTVGRSLLDFVPENRRDFVRLRADQSQHSRLQVYEFDNELMIRADGTEFAASGNSVRTITATDTLVTVKFRDMSDVQKNEAKQREYAAILEQISDAVLVCDTDSRVRSCNDSAETLLGISEREMAGQSVRDLLAVDTEQWERDRIKVIETGLAISESSWVSPAGQEYVLEQRRSLIRDNEGTPIGKLLFLIDITDRVRDEAKERRNQRLESIGRLTGGIAHDLNNVLTPIVMSAKLLKRGSKTPERLVDNIITSADRGGRMIKKLLSFASGGDGERTRLDLRELLSELEEILSHALQQTIDLQVTIPAKLRNIDADSTELSQVIMNLAINARDAMPNGGRLDISIGDFDVDQSRADRSDFLTAGPHVLLTVADNGHGIPKEIIDRIFDPFFTTKEQDKGTGLGLATTLGIVRSYNGDITVYSEPDIGTKFSIYLPSSTLSAEIAELDDEDAAPIGKGETILVVDDERLILETAQETLESSQYKVIIASSGAEGVAIYQNQGEKIDLVLLDMMMPGMDGFETKNAIRRMNAQARVIASSGLRRPGQEGGKMADFDGFLPKPYTDDHLLRLVRNIIEQIKS
ncbi:PAS domain S-box protein [Rubripirellula reticaptiva]|uniref:histidine kinase n=1 Tax=Rubripirellula reticaptiva TaxID=2528013 RepID=A0A5C6F7A6_9BACT|nr:PAS domain S-box protein [Rubripirellula reticaptiva]TWU57105.1 Blue-light-activated protein [Rubripirellula reticaptiva]